LTLDSGLISVQNANVAALGHFVKSEKFERTESGKLCSNEDIIASDASAHYARQHLIDDLLGGKDDCPKGLCSMVRTAGCRQVGRVGISMSEKLQRFHL
jgi:hypothetical protein